MTWSYHKRVKIIPGVHLNFGKNGISTSIGVRGANINFGKTGTYLNTTIPGLGLHNRQKLGHSSIPNLPENLDPILYDIEDNIFSSDVAEITSQDLQGGKDVILSTQKQTVELRNDLIQIKRTLGITKLKLITSYFLLYGLIKKDTSEKIKANIRLQKEVIVKIQQKIDTSYVELDVEFEDEIQKQYENMILAFKNLATSQKIWDVTGSHYNDQKVTRSAASTVINKREVRFGIKPLPFIKTRFEVLWLKNANGADLYIYPNFIIMHSSSSQFAIIGLNEIRFFHSYSRFLETGTIPRDTKIIDKTWAKVNKNGSPDKRFKGNYQIPIVRYGEISLSTNTGLNEKYHFSNYEFTEKFGNAFETYRTLITGVDHITA
ncbi:DUF4236 domain-containing protein [Flavobacterium sp. N3904]|uniref:DUF4236 domain-containing protein n=1 Tax=Flavobacterium sp. N3904 TaxID=2986835 RepID=UPI002224C4A2|nr:DUF4236 domain-containing protein [Flavobacterium sp. N3904]